MYYIFFKAEIQQPEKLKEFFITFDEHQLDPINITGYTYEGETTEICQNISVLNITKVHFVLTWIDDITSKGCIPMGGAFDTFDLYVIDPNRTVYNNESKYEYIDINVNGSELPTNQSFNASSVDEVGNFYISSEKMGNWTIRIKVEAEGYTFASYDEGNDWTLSITVYYYTGTITEQ